MLTKTVSISKQYPVKKLLIELQLIFFQVTVGPKMVVKMAQKLKFHSSGHVNWVKTKHIVPFAHPIIASYRK